MEKFNRTLRGYDPDEVNKFLDQVIKQVEGMVEEIKEVIALVLISGGIFIVQKKSSKS